MTSKSFPCPKCQRILQPEGVIEAFGEKWLSYQCPECIACVDFMGEKMELPLSFCIGKDGKPFDPATPDGSLPI